MDCNDTKNPRAFHRPGIFVACVSLAPLGGLFLSLLQQPLHQNLVAVSFRCELPLPFDADLLESGTAKEPEARLVVRPDITPELVQMEPFASVAAEDVECIGRITPSPVVSPVDQNADAGTAVERVEFEEIDDTDGPGIALRLGRKISPCCCAATKASIWAREKGSVVPLTLHTEVSFSQS